MIRAFHVMGFVLHGAKTMNTTTKKKEKKESVGSKYYYFYGDEYNENENEVMEKKYDAQDYDYN